MVATLPPPAPVRAPCESSPARDPTGVGRGVLMKLYADLRGRRTVQVVTDLLVLLWVLVCAWLGGLVHDAVSALAAPARQLERAGGGFHDTMAEAAGSLSGLPLIDDRLSAPFTSVASTGTQIERTGRDIATSVEHLAVVLGWASAVVPIVPRRRRLAGAAGPVRPARVGRPAARRLGGRSRPLRAAGDDPSADDPDRAGVGGPGGGVAPRRAAHHPRTRRARAALRRAASPGAGPRCHDVTIRARRSAAGGDQVVASASTWSPERMSLTWWPCSPTPGNQT